MTCDGPMEAERERFCQAVQQCSRAMYRAARALTACDADAEDAVGEAVLRAWAHWRDLRSPDAVRGWLVKIAVNCAREEYRKRGPAVCTPLEELTLPAADASGEGLELWDAVLRLPPDHRSVVTLFYYEDMPLSQIAKVLGVAQGTVKSRLSRARESLKQMLREEVEP